MAPTSGVLTSTIFGKASNFVMPLKKITALGAALQPLDTNQETLSLREARSQKRKATTPTLQEEELDHALDELGRARTEIAHVGDLFSNAMS